MSRFDIRRRPDGAIVVEVSRDGEVSYGSGMGFKDLEAVREQLPEHALCVANLILKHTVPSSIPAAPAGPEMAPQERVPGALFDREQALQAGIMAEMNAQGWRLFNAFDLAGFARLDSVGPMNGPSQGYIVMMDASRTEEYAATHATIPASFEDVPVTVVALSPEEVARHPFAKLRNLVGEAVDGAEETAGALAEAALSGGVMVLETVGDLAHRAEAVIEGTRAPIEQATTEAPTTTAAPEATTTEAPTTEAPTTDAPTKAAGEPANAEVLTVKGSGQTIVAPAGMAPEGSA